MMSARDIMYWIVGGALAVWGVIGVFWFLLELAKVARGEDNDGE